MRISRPRANSILPTMQRTRSLSPQCDGMDTEQTNASWFFNHWCTPSGLGLKFGECWISAIGFVIPWSMKDTWSSTNSY